MSKLRIGFVLTGSFCTFAKVIPVIQALIERGDSVTPILSDSAGTHSTPALAQPRTGVRS